MVDQKAPKLLYNLLTRASKMQHDPMCQRRAGVLCFETWFSRTLHGTSGNGCRRSPEARSILLRALVPTSALSFKTREAIA